MSFFNKLGEKLAQTSQSAAQKTKSTAETLKLKSMISDEEKNINNVYQQIGRVYYETCGDNPEESFVQLVSSIKDSEEKISNCVDQIRHLKGTITCQECNGEVPDGSAYCCTCGSPIVTTPEVDDSDNTCDQCGFVASEDLIFCTECGNNLRPAAYEQIDETLLVEHDPDAQPIIEEPAAEELVSAEPAIDIEES